MPAGFGHFELFDDATFGDAEIADLLSRFPAFDSYPNEAHRSILIQQLREMGRLETERKAKRNRVRQTERQRLEMEENNAAIERSIQRTEELVRPNNHFNNNETIPHYMNARQRS